MASKYKAKAELIAIYRLEFYRKQKNWKFCQDVCKKSELKPEVEATLETEPKPDLDEPQKNLKPELNKTYNININTEQEDEAPSSLNKAFLEAEPDKTPLEAPLDPKEDNNKNLHDKQIKQQHLWAQPEKSWPEWAYPVREWPTPEVAQHNWQNIVQPVYLGCDGGQEYYSEQQGYVESCSVNDLWSQHVGVDYAVEAMGDVCEDEWCPNDVLDAADRWLQGGHTSTTEELFSGSFESFMLGAAAAPHSSEIDLRTRSAASERRPCTPGLSSTQLVADVARHANALRNLLLEARARDQLVRSSQSLEHTQDEPNRDPGPSPSRPTLRRQETFVKDSFVAGSFKTEDDLPGRGRGRLRSRPGVIGIGMGRPYRL